ncbi:MAG: hypothetical protein A3E85_05180 [Gammaproteobacteria bacterium RIFCSPHIGHO2_12_FULL_45_12]|nr:MAG: hypothetical protein A3E85_05180 [Gammaproteobacteria bacterium RIFCSPHIGHO2_12_FULL_45_12]
MFLKKTALTGFITLALGLPLISEANDLTIINNTNFNSTSIINNGKCSSKVLPFGKGTTKAHTTNVITSSLVNLACLATPSPKVCQADVYMADDCGGSRIATAYFDTKTGMQSVTLYDQSYRITGTGFTITLDGGPSFLSRFFNRS